MSDHKETSLSTAQPVAAAPAVPYNFPLPAPVKLSGDVYQNFKFFRMQWEDYEVATQLTEKPDSKRMATLRSVMGQKMYQHLQISDADKAKVRFRFICCFTSRSTARVILRRVVYRWRKPVHCAL